MLIETERLVLRPLTPEDELALSSVLSDAETMRWYPRPLTRDEVRAWIDCRDTEVEFGVLLGRVAGAA